MIEVGIGLGANLEDRCGNIIAAVSALAVHPSIDMLRVSSVYETPAWGVTEQPGFLNAAVLVGTILLPDDLLTVCKDIEVSLGRVTRQRWGPREIDIDLLFFGDAVVESDRLTLPHPRLFERLFALQPLCEVAGSRRVGGRNLIEALEQLQGAEQPSGICLDVDETKRLKSELRHSKRSVRS